jgi:hypothetical protein
MMSIVSLRTLFLSAAAGPAGRAACCWMSQALPLEKRVRNVRKSCQCSTDMRMLCWCCYAACRLRGWASEGGVTLPPYYVERSILISERARLYLYTVDRLHTVVEKVRRAYLAATSPTKPTNRTTAHSTSPIYPPPCHLLVLVLYHTRKSKVKDERLKDTSEDTRRP